MIRRRSCALFEIQTYLGPFTQVMRRSLQVQSIGARNYQADQHKIETAAPILKKLSGRPQRPIRRLFPALSQQFGLSVGALSAYLRFNGLLRLSITRHRAIVNSFLKIFSKRIKTGGCHRPFVRSRGYYLPSPLGSEAAPR